MNPEVYGEWCRRQGLCVIKTESTHWYSEGFGVYQAFPFDRQIKPDEKELTELFSRHKVAALRFSSSLESGIGSVGYHVVYERDTYDLQDLSVWARKNVRRGLKSCIVERIPFERFLLDGWSIRRDTLDRQGREAEKSGAAWLRKYSSAADLPGFEVWGALVKGELGAFLLTFRMSDCVYMIHQQCKRSFMREHVNNALAFVVTQAAVANPEVRSVCYGIQSLDAAASVDEFKFRMGYVQKKIRQRVLIHPLLAPAVNRVTQEFVKGLHRLMPRNRIVSKAEGLFRLSLADADGDPANVSA